MQPGLLQQPQQLQQPPQAQPQQQPQQQPAGDPAQQYEQAYLYVERLAAHPQASEKLADMIAAGESLPDGLAEATAFILLRVEAHLQISDEVKLELVGDILEVVFEIAGEMGVLSENEVTDDLIKSVVAIGTERYAEMHEQAGMPLNPEDARAELDELERSGAIDEARQSMPEDADTLDHLLSLARQGA